ncbi:sucrase/ferredoxin domain-containing protein [Pestalotiopsis sp. NC0098]|nr:sucrase/ferredoxin domain-containing protein [Pestalotiopsis sp. NC0098]
MSPPRSTTRKIFHYIYNTVYVLLCLLLAALVLVTPGDAIRQTYQKTLQYTNIVIIAIAYLVTVLIVLFIYSLRLYVTRTVLASIPKSWVPINKGEIKKHVREVIHKELARSAAIAWQARPKVSSASFTDFADDLSAVAEEDEQDVPRDFDDSVHEKESRPGPSWQLKRSDTAEEEMGIALPPTKPVWGHIDHPGWGSPESPDLANIQYGAVLAELPNLIEGKAMSLAPAMPDSGEAPLLDPEAVAALQRLGNMTMRTYVGHLVDLEVLEASKDISEFLDVYERARFSTKPIPGDMFRRLMHLFAELLRSAKPLDRGVLETIRSMDDMYSDSNDGSSLDEQSFYFARSRHRADIDDDAPQNTSPTTPAHSIHSLSSDSSPKTTNNSGSILVGGSSGAHKAGRSRTVSSKKQRLQRTTSNISSIRSGSSANSFAQSRKPYLAGSSSSSGHGSSLRSGSRGSGGSVIRLATHDDAGDLPYVLRVATTQ